MLLTVFSKISHTTLFGHIFDYEGVVQVREKNLVNKKMWTPIIDVIFYTDFTKDGNRVLRSTEKHFMSKVTERNYDL